MALTALNRAQSGRMEVLARGAALHDRRLRLKMSVNQLQKASGVSRNAITAAEAGEASELTYRKLESWFDDFEVEVGDDVPEPPEPESGLVTFELSGDFGVRVVVKGPIRDRAELEDSVARLIREMRSSGAQSNDP